MTDHETTIRGLALGLDADLRRTGTGLSAEVVEEGGGLDDLSRRVVAGHGIAIAIRHHGCANQWLTFYLDDEHDFARQIECALDQVQDVVMEETTEQWPPCPEHSHALTPSVRGDVIGWACPDSARVHVPLGRVP